MCKAFFDAHEPEASGHQRDDDWNDRMDQENEGVQRMVGGRHEKKMLMTCVHLSTVQMKTERNYISAYGAVQMTKEEAIEMVTNCV
eukprot:7552591-Heterocapsa_arctica.AAC.1